jgi:hypothetical protein
MVFQGGRSAVKGIVKDRDLTQPRPTLWHSSNTSRPSKLSPLSHSMTLGGRGGVGGARVRGRMERCAVQGAPPMTKLSTPRQLTGRGGCARPCRGSPASNRCCSIRGKGGGGERVRVYLANN